MMTMNNLLTCRGGSVINLKSLTVILLTCIVQIQAFWYVCHHVLSTYYTSMCMMLFKNNIFLKCEFAET